MQVGSVVKPEACQRHIASKENTYKNWRATPESCKFEALVLCRKESVVFAGCFLQWNIWNIWNMLPKHLHLPWHPPLLALVALFAKVESGYHSTQRWRNAEVCCTKQLCREDSVKPYGYGSIPINTIFSGLFTSNYQLFWGSPGVQGFDPLPYVKPMCWFFILLERLWTFWGRFLGWRHQAGWGGEGFLSRGRCSTFALQPQTTGNPQLIWLWINTYKNTIFSGLFTSINPSYFDVNRRGTRFWPTSIWSSKIHVTWGDIACYDIPGFVPVRQRQLPGFVERSYTLHSSE